MSIKILLDNYVNNECFSGQRIEGRIECIFNNQKKFNAVRIKFQGRAKTKWNEKTVLYNAATKKTVSRNIPQYAEEPYLNSEYNLVGGSGDKIILPAGKHYYPFSFTLPAQLPGSFEGTVGTIRYYIEAVVERPWKFNYKVKIPLNVVLPLDLNFIPRLREPVALSVDTNTRSYLWKNNSGVLTLKLSMPVSGYVPGQEINIGAYIENTTKVTVKCVKFKVVADYEYIVRQPKTNSKINSVVIAKCVESNVGAHGEKSWTSTLLLPTNILYPNLTTCNIIDVRYNIKAEVVLPYPNTKLKLELPITIGSIALSDVDTTIPGPPPLVDPSLPHYGSLNDFKTPYPELHSNGLPPPYSLEGGEYGGNLSARAVRPSPHSFGANTLPPGLIDSYQLPEKSGSLSAGESAPYPLQPMKSVPYPLSVGGSTPYPLAPVESVPYPPSIGGSTSYTLPPFESVAYPPSDGGSAQYSSNLYPPLTEKSDQYSPERKRSEPNARDTTASAPPPSYEQSQL